MKNMLFSKEIWIIIIIYLISRFIASIFHIEFQYNSLYSYWQYLDVETLKHNLLNGVWYNHSQPPLFNIFIGTILKIFGNDSDIAFSLIFKIIGLSNAILLYIIIRNLTYSKNISLLISLFYILSPAAIAIETELFYTTFITLLLLICFYFILKLESEILWKSVIGIFIPLLFICLTRSMYHLIFLITFSTIIFFNYRKSKALYKIIITATICILITSSWYFKNYYLFDSFSTSSWIGMNLSRNVFHDTKINDSTKISSLEPFQKISVYSRFIKKPSLKRFEGLNDIDLIHELKNDSFVNLNHIGYLDVSKKYLEESKVQIKNYPFYYLKNIITSSILFFSPGTTYSLIRDQTRKLKYYDILYSFNLTQLSKTKNQRRLALLISAIPKLILYIFVFFWLFKNHIIRKKNIRLINLLSVIIIGYVFSLSSLLEHYENMRFRFEIEPIFLILLGQFLVSVNWQKNGSYKFPFFNSLKA